ncbi:MAG: bifunctional phosphoserine phosphatase/homoserine phosphotransferase ThrH [Actinomycetota bacterium]
MSRPQSLVALDAEGVIIPEVWIAVADATGIDELRRTTRDEPDYDVLMKGRLAVLADHGITMSYIQDVIAGLGPLPGACEFLDELRSRTQVVILSDTFEQFGAPMMCHLNQPTLLCHRLVVENDRIVDYQLRMPDQKRHAVAAFQSLNYHVVAAGDSYNDTTMLIQADAGFLFHAPANVIAEFPQFPALDTYDQLLDALTEAIT